MKIALITGINGQDGSYLSEFLLEEDYQVHGILKRNSVAENQTARLNNVYNKITLHYADLSDMSSLISVIQKVMPDGYQFYTCSNKKKWMSDWSPKYNLSNGIKKYINIIKKN